MLSLRNTKLQTIQNLKHHKSFRSGILVFKLSSMVRVFLKAYQVSNEKK